MLSEISRIGPSGARDSSSRIHCGKKVKDSAWVAAKRRVAASLPPASRASRRSWMIRRINSSAPVRNCWPAAVRATPLAVRSNKGAPIQSSSARIRRLKAGWVTLRFSAAREKFPVSASATKSSSQISSIDDACYA